MHRDGPVVLSRLMLVQQSWFANSWAAASEVLRDQDRFARDPRRIGRRSLPGFKWWMPKRLTRLANNMLAVDGPEHRRLRALVDRAFLKSEVESLRARIATITDSLLDELESKANRAETKSVDFVQHFCRQLPLTVICEILGLPTEDRPKFSRWFRAFAEIRSAWGMFRVVPGALRILKYLEQQFDEVRGRPRGGLLSDLVQMEMDGDKLSRDELVATVFLLLVAGHETTVHLLSTGCFSLLNHPDQLQLLNQNWDLVGHAVDEVLRFNTPVQIAKPRFVVETGDFYGAPLERGQYITAILGAANADPAKFVNPEQLDIQRSPNPHLAFGSGIHVCLGLKLAKAEAEVAFQRLFQRFSGLQIACPADEVRWISRVGIRSIRSLPLRLE